VFEGLKNLKKQYESKENGVINRQLTGQVEICNCLEESNVRSLISRCNLAEYIFNSFKYIK